MVVKAALLLALAACSASARQLGLPERVLLAPGPSACCCSADGKTCLPATASKTNGACASTVPMEKMCTDADLGYTGAGKAPMTPMANGGMMPAGAGAQPMANGAMPAAGAGAGTMPMPAGNMANGGMPAGGNPMPAGGAAARPLAAMTPGMMMPMPNAGTPMIMPMPNAGAPMMGRPMPNAAGPMPMPRPMPGAPMPGMMNGGMAQPMPNAAG